MRSARVAGLRSELVQLEQAFARNIRDDVRRIELSESEELDGLPPDFIAAHPPGSDGTIRISTDAPDHGPFMNYAISEGARLAHQLEFTGEARRPIEKCCIGCSKCVTN